MTDETPPLLDELRACGEQLPAALRDRIVAEGARIIPALIEVLLEDEDDDDDDDDDETSDDIGVIDDDDDDDNGGGGWASIHAVDLLADLKAEAAIGPMLHVLAETDWDYIIHDRIVLRLHELGAPVLEPALAMLDGNPPEDLAESLCAVVSQLGVRDERVFEHLVTGFAENPEMASGWLADYGDERGLPLIEEAIREFGPDWDHNIAQVILADLVEAYERLGGSLPDELRAHVDDLTKRLNIARAPASSTKIGRNDPCPCGSGKKYKRCHLGTDV